MSRTGEIEALAEAANALGGGVRGLRDEDLLDLARAWEAIGRVVDGCRMAVAAEVQWRSRPQLGDAGLANQRGERSGIDLLGKELRISGREAKRRITLGTALAPRLSLQGEESPGRYPAVAAAVRAGEMPLDSARVIVDALTGVQRRAVREELDVAEEALVEAARESSPDLVQDQARVWAMRLDQDGAEPTEEQQRRDRAFRLGTADGHGLFPFSGRATAEDAALVRSMLEAHRKKVHFTCEGDDQDAEDPLPEWREAEGDHRTKA